MQKNQHVNVIDNGKDTQRPALKILGYLHELPAAKIQSL